MTFLFAVNADIGLSEVMSLYNHACHPDPANRDPRPRVETACGIAAPHDTGPSPIAWEDGVVNGVMHGGILGGARRKWGDDDDAVDTVQRFGNEHGVSADVAPL